MAAVATRDAKRPALQDAANVSRAARVGQSAELYARLKARTSLARQAPGDVFDVAGLVASEPANAATGFASRFEGLANSATVCPIAGSTSGCQPPDQAIAASRSAILQAVNLSVAEYDPNSGVMRHAWPMPFDAFLGGGPSAKIASCDPYGPFLSDPRAFYDPNDQRFFVSVGQFDAPGFSGPKDTCANLSFVWVAVSVDSNPDDGFYEVALDASEGGQSLADYPRLGFDQNTVEVSTNSFSYASGAFTGSPMFYLSKYDLENGILTTSRSYTVLYNGIALDTMQPVETLASLDAQPGILYNVVSFNANFGGGSCSTGCSNASLIAIANPLSPRFALLATPFVTPAYALAPDADDQYCTPSACIETLDTRIGATPTYVATANGGGAISWALETARRNATQVVPAFLYGIVDTAPTKGDPLKNFAGTTRVTGFVVASGDVANSFPATMLTNGGKRLSIVADVMGNFLYPAQVAYTLDTGSTVRGPYVLHAGIAPDSLDGRWGDYSATSFDGSNVWVSGQYSGGGGDWATAFGKLR